MKSKRSADYDKVKKADTGNLDVLDKMLTTITQAQHIHPVALTVKTKFDLDFDEEPFEKVNLDVGMSLEDREKEDKKIKKLKAIEEEE